MRISLSLIVSLTALLCAPRATHAQGVSFSASNFNPTVNPHGTLVTEGGRTIPHLTPTGMVLLHYAHQPVRLIDPADTSFGRDVLAYRLNADVLLGFGLFDRLELGLAVPVALAQGSDGLDALGRPGAGLSAGIGDIRIVPKLRLATFARVSLAFAAPVFIPSGSGEDLLGSGDPAFAPTLVGSFDHERFGAALNVGYLVRGAVKFNSPGDIQTVAIDDSVVASLGVRVQLAPRFDAIGDVFFNFATDEQDKEEIPGELIAGIRTFFNNNVSLTFAAGAGLTQGLGAPAFRLLAGLAYEAVRKPPEPTPAVDLDPDHDGIAGNADECPRDPEDPDGFEDEDGCPEEDNDRDGIIDRKDLCPKEAEDKDDFEDDDGCPDPDNDGDGIGDPQDNCKLEPEDKDGFQDEDGCPDTDNDSDGIPDARDRCPMKPEVYNGVDDDDGCPDEGSGPVKVQHGKITTPPVFFATGRDRVLRRSFPTLRLVAEVLQRNSWVKRLRVEGHTDDRGADDYNLSLSQRRADSVLKLLVEYGVAREILEARGYGETQPLESNKRAAGRAKNRRVDFVIVDPLPAPASAPATSPAATD